MPPPVSGSEVILGPVEGSDSSEEGEGGANGGFGAGFSGLIDTTGLAADALIEEPVASGSDTSNLTDCEEPDDGDDTNGNKQC